MSQSDATLAKREAIQKVATEVECNLASAADKAQQVLDSGKVLAQFTAQIG